MALPISYNIRNVKVRWQVTLLAISGIALVVAVMAVLLSMSSGFQMALRATGRPDNALIVQRGSASELTSGVGITNESLGNPRFKISTFFSLPLSILWEVLQ